MKFSKAGLVAVIALGASPVFAGLIGGNVVVNGGGAFPDVAYDSVDGKYLVVWYGGGVFGRFVTNGGAVSGSAFTICDATGNGLFPAIAYNSTNNEFLVTWDDQRAAPYPIWGQRVRGSDGALLGGNFQISSLGLGRSAVAWSSTSNSYLVIAFNWSEVYGQRVSNTGGLLGGTFNISNDAAFSGYPGVGYGSSGNQYLVTWDHDDGRIVGQRVDAGNGALLGTQFTVMTGYLDRSASAYDTVNNRWMVEANYHNPVTSYDQRCQLVSTSGTLIGGPVDFAATMDYEGDSQFGGDICYIPGMNRFCVGTANSGSYEGQSFIEYNNATGTVISFKNLLGVGNYPSSNCAADTALNRYLDAIYAPGTGIVTQLYAASSTAVPGQASNPNPGNGAARVSVTPTLTWTAGSGATSHNVYFGTTNPPLIAATTGSASYTPATLSSMTTYYWQVNEVSDGGTKQGPVWSFTTVATQTSVDINLGNTNIENLMTQPIGGDGDTIGATGIGGHECRRNMDPTANDFYFYFTVNDNWAYQGSKTDVWIYSEYYDNSTTGSITLNYDATSSAYKDGGTVWLTGTNTWKTQKWHVTDAYFGNRENDGGDFRIYVGNVVRYLDNHTVNQNTPGTTPPGQASSPSPLNGATGVSLTPTLLWTAGANATAHNVFFGTTNPPPFAAVQTTTTYIPGTLTTGLTYYWRIDEYRSGGGTTNGNVWSFTVGGTPPGPATNPNPANGATGVGITSTLSWTAGSGATSHDVRFGTANPPPFIQNQAGTTYNPGTTSPSTTYYWRIDEKNAAGTTTGTVWSYTTAAPPNAPTVTAPSNGGTVTTLTPTVTWSGDAHDQYQVRVSQQNDSNTSTNGYDSGTVTSTGSSQVSGTLRNYSFYFVFVRLHTAAGGWGAWSAAGYNFIVNTDSLNGTVYLGNALLSASGWAAYDGTCENGCTGITTSIVSDGGSNVEQLIDASTSNRSKMRYNPSNVSFDTGASVASRMRATSIAGTPTYNLGISNGNVGGLFLRLYTNEVRLVDINGTNDGSYLLDATVYHKYQLTVKNATAGNNATATWKVYVDGTQRITFTGAGVDNGFDGFMAGHAGTGATGTWWFDNISGRQDGEFSPSQWDPVY